MKHQFLKIALCTPKITVGAIDKNLEAIKAILKQADKQNVELAIFGMDCFAGISLGDMECYSTILNATSESLADLLKFSKTAKCCFVVGLTMRVDGVPSPVAAVIHNGKLSIVSHHKHAQPSVVIDGEVFEINYRELFEISWQNFLFRFGITFMEAYSHKRYDTNFFSECGANLIINLGNGSTSINSFEKRKNHIAVASDNYNCAYAYVGCGNGEAVTNTIYSCDKILANMGELEFTSEDENLEMAICQLDLELSYNHSQLNYYSHDESPNISRIELKNTNALPTKVPNKLPFIPNTKEFDRIINIITRGIFTRKQSAKAQKLVLGLSGGLDSTIALLLMVKCFEKYNLDKKDILAVSMPANASSSRTKNNAQKLIDLLEVSGLEIPIQYAVDSHLASIGHTAKDDIVYENAQARKRTHILLDLCNKHNGIMIGTGDLSEIALGWSTFGGDQVAHYNPISSLTKTLIRAMTRWYCLTCDNRELAEVLDDVLGTPISPELKQNQDTEKSIGPYELHDFYLYNLIGKGFSVEKTFYLAALAYPDYKKQDILAYLKIFINRFFTNQFKRTASCDGITLHDYDLTYKTIHSEFNQEQFTKAIEKLEKEIGNSSKVSKTDNATKTTKLKTTT